MTTSELSAPDGLLRVLFSLAELGRRLRLGATKPTADGGNPGKASTPSAANIQHEATESACAANHNCTPVQRLVKSGSAALPQNLATSGAGGGT